MTPHAKADAASYRAMTAPHGKKQERLAEARATRTQDLLATTTKQLPALPTLKGVRA